MKRIFLVVALTVMGFNSPAAPGTAENLLIIHQDLLGVIQNLMDQERVFAQSKDFAGGCLFCGSPATIRQAKIRLYQYHKLGLSDDEVLAIAADEQDRIHFEMDNYPEKYTRKVSNPLAGKLYDRR